MNYKIFTFNYLKQGKKRIVKIVATKKRKAKKYFENHYSSKYIPLISLK